MAAEYILKEGNEDVMLCERGIRTFETAYRFTLDLMAVPVLKQLTHLPVIVDPSHAAGRRDLVEPLSLAAAAAGADGIIVEVHPNPEEAICDGPQALRAEDFAGYAPEGRAGRRDRRQGARRRPFDGCRVAAGIGRLTSVTSGSSRSCRCVAPGAAPRRAAPDRRAGRRWSCAAAAMSTRSSTARTTACWSSSGPCSVHDPDAALEYAGAPERPGGGAAATSCCVDDARLLREAAHDDRLEGPDQRPAPRRLGRRQRRPAHGARRCCSRCSRLGLPVGCEFLDPITPQYIADAVAWGAIGARTDREPDPPPARVRPVDAGRLQEPHRRQRPGGGRRGARGRRVRTPSPASTTTGTPAILHTRGNPDCHVILRGGSGAPNYDAAPRGRRRSSCCAPPACPSAW